MMEFTEKEKLTEEEAEQYDRQIRLWGLEAQKRLRMANVLVIGMNGLAAEVCKNVVLAGVKSLTIMDTEYLPGEDIGNRFLRIKDGENRVVSAMNCLQSLNPNVSITADTDSVESKEDQYFGDFNLMCVTGCSTNSMIRLNNISRKYNIKFFSGDVWGYYGYFFTDLQQHSYAIEVPKSKTTAVVLEGSSEVSGENEDDETANETTTQIRMCSFCSLQDALSMDWKKKPGNYFRRTPPSWFTIQVLQEFRDQIGRNPSTKTIHSDQEKLDTLRYSVTEKNGVKVELIAEDFSSYCFSELSPVCAVVGGVLSQEIIKAVSGKDAPFQNTFLYNGVTSTGIVESLHP